MDKKPSRSRAVYACSNWPTVIIDKETTAFVDAMTSRDIIFRNRSSRSKILKSYFAYTIL